MNRVSHVLFVGTVVLVGCEGGAPGDEPAATSTAAVNADDLLARLRAADQLDGQEDHVIVKCYICGLGMDGDPNFAAEHHGYTAHFCSEHCLESFQKDADVVIAETEIPTQDK